MKKISFGIFVGLLGIVTGVSVYAQSEKQDSKPQYSNTTWLSQSKADIRVLNKLESRTELFTVPVGDSIQYKTLTISVQKCVVRPSSVRPDSAAFLDIKDSQLKTIHFSAWMLSAEPGVSVFEHPLYNVSVVGCSGEKGTTPLTSKETPSSQVRQQPQNNDQTPKPDLSNPNAPQDLERSLEDKLNSQ